MAFDFRVEVLSLVLRCLDHSNYFVKLIVLVANHLLLVIQYLPVVHITSLVILTVLAALIPNFLLLSSKCSLVTLNSSIVLGQLTLDDIVDIIDETYAASNLLFTDARVLVRLILVVVHELVKVAQISLQSCPGGLHQVFGTRD